jgi:hypothetical protein
MPIAAAGATVLTIVLAAAIVLGWIVLMAIYMVFFRGRGS